MAEMDRGGGDAVSSGDANPAPGTAVMITAVAAVGGLVDQTVIASAYGLAFGGFLDRMLFVVGVTAVQAALVGLAACAITELTRRSLGDAGFVKLRLDVLLPAAAAILYVLLWLNSFVLRLPRLQLLAVDLAAFTVLLAVAAHSVPRPRLPRLRTRSAVDACAICSIVGAVCWGAAFMAAPAVAEASRAAFVPSQARLDDRTLPVLPVGTNVLLIVADTLRGDHLSHAGYERQTSPNLDRLASRSLVFERAVGQATRTSPNMASLMTATTPLVHGVIESRSVLPESLTTWAEVTREAGYFNYGIVGNPNVGPAFGHGQGMDRFDEMYLDSTEPVDAGALTDRALEWLSDAPPEPFLLWVHVIDPHTPYGAPEPWRWRFRDDPMYARHPVRQLERGSRFGGLSASAEVGWAATVADYVALYDGEVRYMDAEIGRLLEGLDQHGLAGRTIVVFTSDHGESLGEHDYYFSHGDYAYEPTARVPLILGHPELSAGEVRDEVVRTIDVMPTVLDLVGLTPPAGIEGRSLVTEGPPAHAEIAAGFSEYTKLAVRRDDHKLVLSPRVWREFDRLAQARLTWWPGPLRANPYRRRAYRRELYDLGEDPGETTNLAGTGDGQEGDLLEALGAWIDSAPARAVAARLAPGAVDPEVERQLRALGYVR